jgi:hypothetical protein
MGISNEFDLVGIPVPDDLFVDNVCSILIIQNSEIKIS